MFKTLQARSRLANGSSRSTAAPGLGQSMGLTGPFIALAALVLLSFALGGGSRSNITSLMILRPAAVLILGYGCWKLGWQSVRAYRYLFGLAAAVLILSLAHLVPLPPSIWSRMPGRELIAEIDRMAQLGEVWRPMALVPHRGWNSFFATLVPLSAIVLAVQLSIKDHSRLLLILIGLGVLSGVIALLQIIGPPGGPLYFYRYTNEDAATGLFANRNHQAVLLATMFPLLAVYASLATTRGSRAARAAVALGIGTFLLPLILITGSRAGVLSALIGIVAAVSLYWSGIAAARPRLRSTVHHRSRWPYGRIPQWMMLVAVAIVGLGLCVVTISIGRAEAFELIFNGGESEARFKSWGTIVQMARDYFPFGSGLGSFVEVFSIYEPRALLDPTYLNHAHNDWLELIVTAGLPGVVLLTFVTILVSYRAIRVFTPQKNSSSAIIFARLGILVIVILAVASAADYPLRTPALAVLFVIAAVWAATPLSKPVGAVDASNDLPHGS